MPRLLRVFFCMLTLVSLFSFTLLTDPPVELRTGPPAELRTGPPAGLRTGSPVRLSLRPSAEMETDILRMVNLHRRSMGLKALQINALESTLARQHSQNMASGKTPFGHEGFHQREAYLNKKMGPIRLVAENVALGQMSAREVVEGWLQSPGHRRNIEGDFRLTGIGLARDRKGQIYFTQIFSR